MTEEFDPNDAVDFIYRTAPKYAQAKAERIYLTEFRKSKKALLMKSCGELAVAAQEREAYSHPDYLQLLEGIKAAVENEARLEWEIKAAEARIEIWRTREASNRLLDRSTR